MNEKHRRLYDDMIRYQMIPDKSYEEWTLNFSTPQKQKQLYDFLSTRKVNRNGQEVAYFPEGATPEAFYENVFDVKKKDEPQVSEPVSEEASTVSTSDTTQVAGTPSGDSDLRLKVTPSPTMGGVMPTIALTDEKQYFTGEFGDQINKIPIFGDVIDDIGRAWAKGSTQRNVITSTFDPFILTTDGPTDDQLASFVEAVNQSDALTREYGESDEMMDFEKIYTDNGQGVWGFISGVAQNPSILPSLFLKSYSTYANKESAQAALATLGVGAAAGTVVPGVGTVAGAVAATPYAYAAAGAVMETSLAFVEFLKEELGEQEFNLENVSQVLSNPEKFSEIKRRSLLRGGGIGIVNGVGGALISRGIRSAKTLSTLQKTGVAIGGEAVTGGTGEVAARALAGQEMDVAEIGFETVVGIAQAPFTLATAAAQQRLENVEQSKRAAAVDALNQSLKQSVSPASYKLNGESVTKDQLNEMLNVLTDEDLKKVNIEVENDPEVQEALEDRTRTIAINDIIPQEVQGKDRSRIVTLEKELQKFEGKPTETAKKRAGQIKSEISEILDKYQVAPEAEPTAEPTTEAQVEEGAPEAAAPAEPTVEPTAEPEVTPPAEPQQTPEQRIQKLKDDGVFIKEEGLKSKVVDVKQRFFSARKHLPKSVFEAKEKKEALVAKELSIVEQSIAEFNRLLKAVDGDEAKETFTADFDDAIRGGEGLNRLSPEAQELAISMRNQIDRLTIELIDQGLVSLGPSASERKQLESLSNRIKSLSEKEVTPEVQKVIDELKSERDEMINRDYGSDKLLSNLGQYLTRSYRVYDRANWKEQVEDEVIEQAKNFIRPSLSEKADRLVNTDANVQGLDRDAFLESLVEAEIDKHLNPSDVKAFAQAGMGKDLKILEERQDIPKEIRALKGEYANPVQNYAKSILRMSATVEAQRFLNKTAKLGEGTFLQRESTGIFSTEIQGTGSDLDGMFTTPEIAQEFQKVEQKTDALMESYFKVIAGTKYAKTILSIGTHSKNVFANYGFMYANGHLFETPLLSIEGVEGSDDMISAYKTLRNDFGRLKFVDKRPQFISKDDKALNEKMNEYIELGIVKQSASIGEIRDMFKDANMSVAMENRLNNQKLTLKNQTLSASRKTGKVFEDLYQAEDDFFKIVAFEAEKNRYSKALYGKPKSELTAEQAAEVDEYVAKIVKNTYPTYSRVPEAIKMIRRNPLIGNFVSFQAESYRVAYNTIQLGIQESRSDNPEIRKIGAKRLVGATTYQAGKSVVIAAMGAAAGIGAQGLAGMFVDSEEEKQRKKDIRLFSPSWTQEARIVVLSYDNDGKFTFIDVSSSDPYGNFDRIVNSITEGENIGQAFGGALLQIVEPFIGVDIASRRLGNILYNKKDTGGQIYNESDILYEQGKDILKYLYEGTIEPGTFKSIRKVYDSDKKLEELAGQFTGLRPYRVDVREQLGFRLRDLKREIDSAKNIRFDEAEGIIDKAQVILRGDEFFPLNAKRRAEERTFVKEQEAQELFHAAERHGVPKAEIFRIATDAGFTKDNYRRIYRGQKPTLEIAD